MKPFLALAFLCLLISNSSAITLEQLRAVPDITPQNFSSHFSHFKFLFRANVQTPAEFLSTESGDCDDFSTLAATVMAARGYTPRLVAVRMKKEVHVICYINESSGYLDYNLRAKGGHVPCGSDLALIADSVAKSFKNARWTSVSEFTFSAGVKRLVKTTLPKDRLTASNTSTPKNIARN
jgi:hypothetical protein